MQIELKNVYFEYEDSEALCDISLCVEKGECIGLEGDNGSGKSTLLKLLNGLIFPSSGTYLFDGTVINAKSMKDESFSKAFHSRLGYIFQNPDTQLFCSSVREEIEFGPRQMGLSEEEIKRRADDVIEMMGLEKIRDRAPYHLSGGEKKKTAIACVLSMNPEVLMIDEPMNGLDRKSREWMMGFLKAWKAAGKTLLVTTHDEKLLNEITGRIITIGEDHRIL